MHEIDSVVDMLDGMNASNVEVHAQRCIAARNRHAECFRCVRSCTTGALAVDDGELVVHPDLCMGCGSCATACPTSAIEIRSLSDAMLTDALKRSLVATGGHPVLACSTLLDAARESGWGLAEDAVVELPCLGRIDESLLATAAAFKGRSVTLGCGDCGECEHAPGGALCREVVESARGILEAFGCGMRISMERELPERVLAGAGDNAPGNAPSGTATNTSGSTIGQATPDVSADGRDRYWKVDARTGTLSQVVPTRRQRLYNCLKRIGQPVTDTVRSRVIGAATINADKCVGCRMCAVFCPTGALTRVDEDDAYGIAHRPSLCMQCRLCESTCAKDAIHVDDTVPAAQFMDRERVMFPMPLPDWEPNKPDSMYNKFHKAVGADLEMCMF